MTVLGDASIDVGDVVLVQFLDESEHLYMISSINLDLGWGPMSVTLQSYNQSPYSPA